MDEKLEKKLEKAEGKILEAAIKSATGYFIEEDKEIKLKDGVEVVKLRKYIQPNTTMNLFMLKSRFGMDEKAEKKDDVLTVIMDDELENWGR